MTRGEGLELGSDQAVLFFYGSPVISHNRAGVMAGNMNLLRQGRRTKLRTA